MKRRFEKSREPRQLRAWIRDNQPATARSWKELLGDVKRSVRTRMHADQHGLCCYCYARVADDRSSHIEHVEPQSDDNRFDWANLALSCDGGNRSGNPAHCDHAKGQTPLAVIHPYKSPVDRFVTLCSSGALGVADQARCDVEDVLALNRRHLQRLREGALKAALGDLTRGRRRRTRWQPGALQQSLDELRRRNQPLDYQPLIEGWLERRLQRAS